VKDQPVVMSLTDVIEKILGCYRRLLSVELDPNGALAVELTAMEENIARDTWRAGMSTFGTAPAKK